MRRGCITIGEMNCDICRRNIEHGKRYLLIADNEEKEDEKQHICVECCLDKGYASWIIEKGEKVLTFFGE